VHSRYVWDLRYIDSPVLRDEDLDSDGDCTDDEGTGSERLCYANDANFNVTALVETDGAVAERTIYDAYGQPTLYDATWANTIAESASKANEIRFCGYVYDAVVGLYTVRYRVYDPALGRWVQRDPAGYVDGMGLYEYCVGDPSAHADPFGLAKNRVPEGWKDLGFKDAERTLLHYEDFVGAKQEWKPTGLTRTLELSYEVTDVEKQEAAFKVTLTAKGDVADVGLGWETEGTYTIVSTKAVAVGVKNTVKTEYAAFSERKQKRAYRIRVKHIQKDKWVWSFNAADPNGPGMLGRALVGDVDSCPQGWEEVSLKDEHRKGKPWNLLCRMIEVWSVRTCRKTDWYTKVANRNPPVVWEDTGNFRIKDVGTGADLDVLWGQAESLWQRNVQGVLGVK
jgi:RHS repeat-associated protein